ncbi:7813_t:CDS:10 [Paraglomus brasilianum]|uniref:V-type proton ATPase subunit C n=1 Tax=Paraglomus brasilianum TaxID=144538 RepID=A0A9N9DP90_9GLOM|nr:7813_t:CDS:10 [Paraglomus brasilianum]
MFVLLKVPAEGNKAGAFQNLRGKLYSSSADYAEVYQFIIPEFKIGTLDSLVVISDELIKYDQAIEVSIVKIVDILRNLLKNDVDKIRSHFVVNGRSIAQYLKGFQWNTQKYRADRSLAEIAEVINQEVAAIESLMKNKLANYNQVKGNLVALERKQTGNLAVRTLADIVKKEHFVLDSEYLETLLVAVPRTLYKDWYSKYETLTNFVVPRSSQKIAEDDEYGLFNATLFKRAADEFTYKCREEKFIVREFKYDEANLESQPKTNFGEVFSAWIHLKALRVYVESVLRYGLPPDFMSAIIKPKPKMEKKTREVLNVEYGRLGGAMGEAYKDENIEELHNLLGKDYYPYVWFQIQLDVTRR